MLGNLTANILPEKNPVVHTIMRKVVGINWGIKKESLRLGNICFHVYTDVYKTK